MIELLVKVAACLRATRRQALRQYAQLDALDRRMITTFGSMLAGSIIAWLIDDRRFSLVGLVFHVGLSVVLVPMFAYFSRVQKNPERYVSTDIQ